jgi:SNF2 family DNA or RNA helicase
MGMGKTMQTLVYLGSMMRAQSIHNALIVCPKSVVRNWEREANLMFKDIVPKCKVCAITSDMGKEKRIREFTEAFCRWVFDVLPVYLFIMTTRHIDFSQICSSFKQPRLVVTTYGLICSHITELNHIANNFPEWQWCYVILDEGHCIKNSSTNISKHVRTLCRNKKTRRLLLTGTPIQNNLRELHSLFDWATSGQLLGSLRT